MEQSHVVTVRPFATEHSSITAQLTWITIFAGLTAIGAQIEIPHTPVPYTLQTLFVLLAGAFLGKRNGMVSQAMYLLAGIAGVPVFSGFGFGAARLIGPTGGYLMAFPVAAFVVGYLVGEKPEYLRTIVAMSAGLFVIFSLGTVRLGFALYHDVVEAITQGFLIFSWWDVLKLSAAVTIYHRLSRKRPSTG
jgi:biotin transport system substrate-specific component